MRLSEEWILQDELARRPYTPPVQDPPGTPPLKSPGPNKDFPRGVPQDPPPVPVAPPVDLAAHDKADDTAPDGFDPITGLEWKLGPDGKPHFVYPDDEPPIGIDLDKAEADLFQRIQQEELNLAGIPPGGWTIDGAGSGMGGMTPEDIERIQEGNPGAAEKIKKLYKKKQQKTGLPDFLVELNPDQIEALKDIPANIKDLPDAERLQKMREVTNKVNGLA